MEQLIRWVTSTALALVSVSALALPIVPIHSLKGEKTLLARSAKRISFVESWSRYPSPDSIIASFKQDFPYARISQLDSQAHCSILSAENRSLLGEDDPVSGLPAVDRPNPTFVNWYINCLSQFVVQNNAGLFMYVEKPIPDSAGSWTIETQPRPYEELLRYFTEPLLNECAAKDPSDGDKIRNGDKFALEKFYCHWAYLSNEVKSNYIKTWIRRVVGPEDVLLELNIAPSEQAFAESLQAELDDYDLHNDGRYGFLNLPGNVMDVRAATQIIQFLIHIQDTLKY